MTAVYSEESVQQMTLLLTKWLTRFRRPGDVSLHGWLKTLPAEELDRWFLRMHEVLGIDKDAVPDIREMSDLEFEDYIDRLRRLKGSTLDYNAPAR
jgi:hypothetical protein